MTEDDTNQTRMLFDEAKSAEMKENLLFFQNEMSAAVVEIFSYVGTQGEKDTTTGKSVTVVVDRPAYIKVELNGQFNFNEKVSLCELLMNHLSTFPFWVGSQRVTKNYQRTVTNQDEQGSGASNETSMEK